MDTRTNPQFGDTARLGWQQALQQAFGPTQYAQQTQALQQLDPAWYANQQLTGSNLFSNMQNGYTNQQQGNLYSQLMNNVSGDLKAGYGLAPGQQHQIEQQVRGSQSARGNTLGSAAGTAEAFALGDRGNQMYQQRLGNAAQAYNMTSPQQQNIQNSLNYQQSSTPSQQLALIPPVSPDRSMAYVNPNAGFQGQQFGLQSYQNQLGAYGLANQQQGGNPWMSALGAAGSIVGTVAPLLLGFSDPKLKSNVKRIGTNPQGLGLYKYKIKPPARTEIGVMADEVQKKMPDAVHVDPESKMRMVDYNKIAMRKRQKAMFSHMKRGY